jgi:hypothetical protein
LGLRDGFLVGKPAGVGLAEAGGLALGDGPRAEALGVALGSVGAADADGAPGLELGDDVRDGRVRPGDRDGLGCPDGCKGSHDCPLTAVVRLAAAAVPDEAATLTPDAAAATTTPPAIKAAVAGRTCAKRMRTPTRAVSLLSGTACSVSVAAGGGMCLLVALCH